VRLDVDPPGGDPGQPQRESARNHSASVRGTLSRVGAGV
jgi:hypothetical protein